MKICRDCREAFSEAEIRYEIEDMGECHGARAAELRACCPCGSDDMAEAQKCSLCGTWFDEDDLIAQACWVCRANTLRAFQDVCAEYFSEAERRVINDAYAGEMIFEEVED